MDNPYIRRRNKNKIGKSGRKSESILAKKIGGATTIGSGNKDWDKGDIKKGQFLIEAKATEADSFRLERGVLCKIVGEALRFGKIPAVCVSFVTGNGRPKDDGEWALIRLKDFQEYMDWIESRDE